MNTTSYLLIRLALGVSLFGHGLVRLPKLQIFSTWMVGNFEKSMLPKVAVVPFSYTLPIIEFTAGFLIILGLVTKPALIIAGTAMIMLMFGTTLIEQWEFLPSQMIHVLFAAVSFQFIENNYWALDSLLKK